LKLSIHIIKIMSNQEDAWLAHYRRKEDYPSSKPADDDDESMNFQTVQYAKKPVVVARLRRALLAWYLSGSSGPSASCAVSTPRRGLRHVWQERPGGEPPAAQLAASTTNKTTMPDVITELKKKSMANFDMILDTLTKELEKKHAAQIAAKNAEIAVLTKDLEGVVAYLHETRDLMNEAAIQGNV
jgi:hypothetical protein